jgi:hypothetical protein
MRASKTRRLVRSTKVPTAELIARTLDQIAFQMTGNEAILDLGWAHVQAQHIGDLAAPVLAAQIPVGH